MKTLLGYKAEMAPNNKQRTAFLRHAGCARWAYNWGLRQKIEAIDARKSALAAGVPKASAPKVPTAIDLHKQLNVLKKLPVEQGGVPWMYGCSKSAPQEALRNLDSAFQHFFRKCKSGVPGPKGFPRFKSRKRGIGSFKLMPPAVTRTHVRLPRIGEIRLKEHGYLPTAGTPDVRVLGSTVSEHAGHWFVSLQVEQEVADPSPPTHLPVLGVDVGIKTLATCSDGTVFENPRALQSGLARLKLLQQALTRKVKGGSNRRKAKSRVARQHYRVSCIREDALHKASDSITKTASVVVLEDLNVAGMMKNGRLARALADSSMSELHRQIRYKADQRGVDVVTADRWFPSSKMCSSCGNVKKVLTLSEREYVCDACGFRMGRDVNAAINLRNLAVSSTVTACRPGSAGDGRKTGVKLLVGQEPDADQALSLIGLV